MVITLTHLPAEFIGKPPNPLQYHPRRKHPMQCLPFVAAANAVVPAPYWHVPATGGYFGGYATGEAMALALLKYLRAGLADVDMLALIDIVGAFIARYEQEGGQAMVTRHPDDWSPAFSSLRGQCTGFFNTMSIWLGASARHLGGKLDAVTERSLLRHANAGLGFDCTAYWASLPDDEDEEPSVRKNARAASTNTSGASSGT